MKYIYKWAILSVVITILFCFFFGYSGTGDPVRMLLSGPFWCIAILPVILIGFLISKIITKIKKKFIIVLINIVWIPIATWISINLLLQWTMFDNIVRVPENHGFGLDLSMIIYFFATIFLSTFLIIGYSIASIKMSNLVENKK